MSGGFDWPALMRAGIQGLGLAPEAFWRLTPAELLLMLGEAEGAAPMRRDAFEALVARFPDVTEARHDRA
jgi:uncharacterized phage protein (TIGR02216 family)